MITKTPNKYNIKTGESRKIFLSNTGKIRRLFCSTAADELILSAAVQNWKLLLLNLFTSLFSALLEGGTLGIIFLAVTLLTQPEKADFNQYAVINSVLGLGDWLNTLNEEYIFLTLLLFAVAAQLLVSTSNYLNSLSVGYLAATLRVQVTEQVHQQAMRFSFSHASHYKVGDLIDYIVAASSAVRVQISQVNNLLVNNCLLLTYIAVMVAISPWLLIAAIFMASLLYCIQKYLLPRIRSTATESETYQVEFAKQVVENIQGLRFLHTYGQQQAANQKVEQALNRLLPSLKRQVRQLSLLAPISQALPIMMLAILTGVAFLIFQDRDSGVLPSLATFVLALQRFNIRLQGIMNARNALADNHGRMQRLKTILDPSDKEFSRCTGLTFSGLKTDIELRQLTLRYQPNQPDVLRGIQLVIPRGKTTALVGESGSGKSSLADLLIGLYEPSVGSIQLNQHDLRDYDPVTWRQYLGVVSQDTFTFNASILENIRLGRITASDDEVFAAAEAAQANDFIRALPEGYSTVVGERGYRLSGGQRQRISLARSILRNPEILILDEATSALDSQSEKLVQQALQKFGQNRTVIVIAHRLSTIVEAEKIVVLNKGLIAEQGTHVELLSSKGIYAKYWRMQSQDKNLVHST